MDFHTSKAIIGTQSSILKGCKIVLCISGSVAAIRSPDIARELMRNGAEVYAVLSQSASEHIVHPHLLEWATGNPVVTQLTGKVEHVTLAGKHQENADLILVAPSTANTISKIACGIDDTSITTVVSTAFGSRIPILIVPAMHASMYKHPIVAENIKKLQSLGVEFLEPRLEEGVAKIAEVSKIVDAVINRLSAKKDLTGKQVVVTAGSTFEPIDPVRLITNRSSGKMGVAVTQEALARGARVTLIYGGGTVAPPVAAKVLRVTSTKEMYDAVMSELKSRSCDIFFATAAVADWAPEKPLNYKVSTHKKKVMNLKLKPTPKIIDVIKKSYPETFLVAFRAEYGLTDAELIESAYKRLKVAGADLIAANDVGRENVGFAVDTNELVIVDGKKNVIHTSLTSKREVAGQLLDIVVEKLRASESPEAPMK